MTRPEFSTAEPGAPLLPQYCPPGVAATEFDPGDFILVKGTGVRSRLIRLGQRIRIHGADRKYVDWTHAALIVDGAGTLIEAVGTGVQESALDRYTGKTYSIFRITASDEDRAEVVGFARYALGQHAKYGPLTVVSIALALLTGSKLTFFIDGQYVCSSLVAHALERTGSVFDRCSDQIAPADLAKYFDPAQRSHLAASG